MTSRFVSLSSSLEFGSRRREAIRLDHTAPPTRPTSRPGNACAAVSDAGTARMPRAPAAALPGAAGALTAATDQRNVTPRPFVKFYVATPEIASRCDDWKWRLCPTTDRIRGSGRRHKEGMGFRGVCGQMSGTRPIPLWVSESPRLGPDARCAGSERRRRQVQRRRGGARNTSPVPSTPPTSDVFDGDGRPIGKTVPG